MLIGQGSQGTVFLKDDIAIKKSKYENLDKIRNEYKHLLEINRRIPKHSHIIKVYNFYNNSYSMEYLQDYQQLSENYIETLSLHQRESIFNQVEKTLMDLHNTNYVHGDLRMLENIMYNSETDNIKLVDCGYCCSLDGTSQQKALHLIKIDYQHLWMLKNKLGLI